MIDFFKFPPVKHYPHNYITSNPAKALVWDEDVEDECISEGLKIINQQFKNTKFEAVCIE